MCTFTMELACVMPTHTSWAMVSLQAAMATREPGITCLASTVQLQFKQKERGFGGQLACFAACGFARIYCNFSLTLALYLFVLTTSVVIYTNYRKWK